jgi:hypothetical protein
MLDPVDTRPVIRSSLDSLLRTRSYSARSARAIVERIDVLRAAGVGDSIIVFHTPHQWPLDVLTINDENVIIGFPAAAGNSHLRHAASCFRTSICVAVYAVV